MTKVEANKWYCYMHKHEITDYKDFLDYYSRYKNWFDNEKYDPKYDLAPTICTSDLMVPCQEQGNNPMDYIINEYAVAAKTACKPQPQPVASAAIQVVAGADTAEEQRKYLRDRIGNIKYDKYGEIAKQFYRDEPRGPKTIKELKERLKKGLYTIIEPKNYDEDEDEDEDHFYWGEVFSWRTADTQFDKEGYDAAYKELSEFVQDCIDQIRILDPKDGLKLLDELKKWKPSKSKK